MSQQGQGTENDESAGSSQRGSQGGEPPAREMAGRTVALCVTGSIAAYKAVELARLLVKAGARVLPVMTASASRTLRRCRGP